MDFLRRKVYGIQIGCKSMNGWISQER